MRRLRPYITVANGLKLGVVALLAVFFIAGSTMNNSSPDSSAKTQAAAQKGKNAAKRVTKPLWSELTPEQREALGPLEPEWDHINSTRKKKWLEIGNKMLAMSPEEKQRVQDRIRDWVKLTPEQRRIARQNYARAQKLKPEEKTSQWQQYQQLPEEQKRQLAASGKKKKQVVNPASQSQSKEEVVAPIKSPPPRPDAPPQAPAPQPSGEPQQLSQ